MSSHLACYIATAFRNLRVVSQVSNTFKVIANKSYSTMEIVAETDTNLDDHVANKSRTRYNGRIKKRTWEEGSGSRKKLKEADDTFVRIKKKKMAVLLGYSGVNYVGMQRNPGIQTIEEDLLSALLKAEYIDKEGFDCMQQIDFQRAARTDKGVSAVRQVVSLKLPEAAVPEKINEHLPEFIRVFGIKRVTKGFNSKAQCDARTYSYTLPSFAFESSAKTPELQKGYRIPQTKIDEINKVLTIYKGTKNYHNFTSRKAFSDPSCLRYMMSFQVDKVFIHSDLEFILLKVKGQSFMLHQIRKMVGTALMVLRGLTPMSSLERAFTEEKLCLPIVPGLGLLLEQVHYDRYDARYGKDGVHDTLDWMELDEIIENFKMQYIIPNTVKTEIAEDSMALYVDTLDEHSIDKDVDKVEENGVDDDGENDGDDNEAYKIG